MALFEGIGRVSDYAQLNNLRREAKYRVKTGQSLVQAMGAPLQISRQRFSEAQESNTKRDAERESLIRQKLRNGQKLSPMDKQYLKEKDPDLYDKVARIEERREALAPSAVRRLPRRVTRRCLCRTPYRAARTVGTQTACRIIRAGRRRTPAAIVARPRRRRWRRCSVRHSRRAIACRSTMRGYISCARSSVSGWSMRTPRSTGTSRIRYAMRQRRRHAASTASSTRMPHAFLCILRRVPQRCSPHSATIMRRSAEHPSRRRAEQYAAARTPAK